MAVGLHNLSAGSKRRKVKRVGRGNGSGRGGFSGRGWGGQRSRSGGKKGLKARGLRPVILQAPKFKGMKPLVKAQVVTLAALDKYFKAGEIVNRANLLAKKLIADTIRPVKILTRGKLSQALEVQADCQVSVAARQAIEAVGGKIIIKEEAQAK